MSYTHDDDLDFLGEIPSAWMNDLLCCLARHKNGEDLATGELLESDSYNRYGYDYHKYWQEIAGELQHFGGNAFASLVRGHGVLYRDILMEVCDKLKVSCDKNVSTYEIEFCLLTKVLEEAVEKMAPEEYNALMTSLSLNTNNPTREAFAAAGMGGAFKVGGFLSCQLAAAAANLVWRAVFGSGLSLAANAGITRGLGILFGPIGWAALGVWTAVDIAGTAFRVTVPAVFQVSLLRGKAGRRAAESRGRALPFCKTEQSAAPRARAVAGIADRAVDDGFGHVVKELLDQGHESAPVPSGGKAPEQQSRSKEA